MVPGSGEPAMHVRSPRRLRGPLQGTVVGDVVGNVVAPVSRTTAFYARSWARWIGRHGTAPEVPVPWPGPSLAWQAMLDEVVLSAAFALGLRARPPAESTSRAEEELTTALGLYEENGWLKDPSTYFAVPPALIDPELQRLSFRSLDYEWCRFQSGYEPHPGEPGRDRWLDHQGNRTAHAWVLRHPRPRPWLVCVHGAAMGKAAIDLTCFRAAWLHHKLGLNVALTVLPGHGPRLAHGGSGARFPGDDALDTIHGFSQAVWDVRRLVTWIRSQGDDLVGVKGLSLGTYPAALMAALEPDLACVIAGVPVADFHELVVRNSPSSREPADRAAHLGEMAWQVHRVVCPLSMPSRVPHGRRFIYAGLADRLVHPRWHAFRLWTHWDRPRMHWYEGSHVGFYTARSVRGFVHEALAQSGLVPAATGPGALEESQRGPSLDDVNV